jgi:hypothetical protein
MDKHKTCLGKEAGGGGSTTYGYSGRMEAIRRRTRAYLRRVGRPSEMVDCGNDHRFFEYPPDEERIRRLLEGPGFRVVATQMGTTSRNIHTWL